jgi:hypothetical protein
MYGSEVQGRIEVWWRTWGITVFMPLPHGELENLHFFYKKSFEIYKAYIKT